MSEYDDYDDVEFDSELVDATRDDVDDTLREYLSQDGMVLTDWLLIAAYADPAAGNSNYIILSPDGTADHAKMGLSQVLNQAISY